MYKFEILIEDEEQAAAINKVLLAAEEEGELDFGFDCKISEVTEGEANGR